MPLQAFLNRPAFELPASRLEFIGMKDAKTIFGLQLIRVALQPLPLGRVFHDARHDGDQRTIIRSTLIEIRSQGRARWVFKANEFRKLEAVERPARASASFAASVAKTLTRWFCRTTASAKHQPAAFEMRLLLIGRPVKFRQTNKRHLSHR